MKYRTVLGLWLLRLLVVWRGRGSVEKPGFASPCPDAEASPCPDAETSPCPDADCGKTGRIDDRGAEAGRGREGVK